MGLTEEDTYERYCRITVTDFEDGSIEATYWRDFGYKIHCQEVATRDWSGQRREHITTFNDWPAAHAHISKYFAMRDSEDVWYTQWGECACGCTERDDM
jgi:hypothetical protein